MSKRRCFYHHRRKRSCLQGVFLVSISKRRYVLLSSSKAWCCLQGVIFVTVEKALFLSPSKRRYFYHRRKGVIACLPQQRDAAIKFSITCSALRQCIVRWQIHRSTVLCGFMAVGEVLRTYGHVWNFRLEDLRGKPGELPHERTGGQSTGLPPIQRV